MNACEGGRTELLRVEERVRGLAVVRGVLTITIKDEMGGLEGREGNVEGEQSPLSWLACMLEEFVFNPPNVVKTLSEGNGDGGTVWFRRSTIQ